MNFSEAAENKYLDTFFIVKVIVNTAQQSYISFEISSAINCLAPGLTFC